MRVKQNPDNPDVHSARACCTSAWTIRRRPTSEFRDALRLAPHDPTVINNYAVYLCQTGRTDEGVKRFLEAARTRSTARRRPPTPTPACACAPPSATTQARRNFERALQIRPNFAEAAYQLADLEFAQR